MSGKSHNEFVQNNREFLELYQAKNLQKETKEPALLEIEKKLDTLISLLSRPKTILIIGDEVGRFMDSLQPKESK